MTHDALDPSTVIPQHFMLDLAPVYVAYVDSSERYRYANERFKELYRRDDMEIVGLRVQEVASREAYAKIKDYLSRALEGERVEYRQWLAIEGRGERFFQVSYTPHSVGGEVNGVVIYGMDVTEAKLVEDARRASEERFRSMFENAATGIALISSDGQILAVNEYVCEIFCYSQADLVGRSRLDFGHPDDEAATQHAIQRLVSGDASRVELEKRYFRGDGKLIWVRTSFSLIRNSEGDPHYFIAVLTDISQRKAAQHALAEREGLYRSVFENAAVGIARVSPEGNWLEVNDRLCLQLGYSREELLSRTFREVTHPDDLGSSTEALLQAHRGDTDTFALDKRYVRADGSVLWAQVTISVVRDEDSKVLYFVTVVEDITARKEAEEALRDLNEDLENRVLERTAELKIVNQELDAFNYTVSHDLRAPLRALSGFSEAVLNDYAAKLDGLGRGYLERMSAASNRMGELLDGLLLLSNYSRSRLNLATVDLSAIAAEQAQALRDEDPDRKVTFSIQAGITAKGDERLLQILIENLLRNAWKYSRDTESPRIEVGTEHMDGETVYFVRDNGAGFDQRYADKLFVPFQRLHPADQFEGQGIGLATVKRIVLRHRGRTWAEGNVDAGATFYFTLADQV